MATRSEAISNMIDDLDRISYSIMCLLDDLSNSDLTYHANSLLNTVKNEFMHEMNYRNRILEDLTATMNFNEKMNQHGSIVMNDRESLRVVLEAFYQAFNEIQQQSAQNTIFEIARLELQYTISLYFFQKILDYREDENDISKIKI